MDKITTINGILMATQNDFNEHVEDATVHVTEEERTAWNAKADASALASHEENAAIHVSREENDTRYGQLNAENTWTQPQTCNAVVNAKGGICVPVPSSAQEALNYDSWLFFRAANEWPLVCNSGIAAIPAWCEIIHRWQAGNIGCRTANASLQYGAIISDNWHHLVFTFTPAPGLSLLLGKTHAWQFSGFIGDYGSMEEWAGAVSWYLSNADRVSLMLGSTSHGYGSENNSNSECYNHSIHWATSNMTSYRYPYTNSINKNNARDSLPAYQITTYGKEYLGSSSSCLVRGTHYGAPVDQIEYVWALVPSLSRIAVAMAPRSSQDYRDTMNRWELWINGNYVMPMTAEFYGLGHTCAISTAVKAHEVTATRQLGLRMSGMRVDNRNKLGGKSAIEILSQVVMSGVTPKPIPVVEASTLDVPAAGGDVILTVSSVLAEDIYILNDTMCGHDPAAVWCRQSTEQVPGGSGEVTLTLAANATGEGREVWAFISHHYGQASVVKINQAA